MYKSIYNAFKNWYSGGDIFLYADPHFGDEDVRQWRNDNVTDEQQIANINRTVGSQGTIIILGDIGDPTWLKKIRGNIVLVLGNHDMGASKYFEYVEPENIFEGPLFLGPKLLLSHEPWYSPFYLNIHGHTHGEYQLDGNGLNLCAEGIGYTPISMKKLRESGILGRIPDIHLFNKEVHKRLKTIEENNNTTTEQKIDN